MLIIPRILCFLVDFSLSIAYNVVGKPKPLLRGSNMDKLKISKMSGKLDGIRALNTDTVSNPFCQGMRKCAANICAQCYSDNMLRTFRKNCRPAFQYNGGLLSSDTDYPLNLRDDIFRISAHGELINYNHARNIMHIIKSNPDTFFAFWTKRPALVQKFIRAHGKPANVNLIYSNPKTDTVADLPGYFDKVFNVHTTDNGDINCGARSCRGCMLCYTRNDTVQVHELVK